MSEVNHNPDVLACLANLSNDEVFTPPEVANAVLDMLPSELWSNPNTKILDPATKSGIFLREAAKRLIEGLADKIPDLQERIDHIMQKQLFGYAITELTAHLSRRSLYCSKTANGPYCITNFKTDCGNILYRRVEHKWDGDKCTCCGASKGALDRGEDMETHAYQFIHMSEKTQKELTDMKFDLIIGNPPYQLSDGGGNGASAMPIYQHFVEQAKKLKPRYMSFIIPSRWFAGGKGLDEFRDSMLHDDRIRIIHDFPDAGDVFPGVQIKAGVCYFLWNRDTSGICEVYTHLNGIVDGPVKRPLLESGCDTFIRYNIAVNILNKVRNYNEKSFMDFVSARLPFGIPNTYKGNKKRKLSTDKQIYVSGNNREVRGTTAYAPLIDITKGFEMIPWHKVFIGKAGSGSDSFPHPILPKPFYGAPETICNESYLVIGPFKDKLECTHVMEYISTRFFRFMVLLKKASQNAAKGVYQFVPIQDFSKCWTDSMLYEKYKLSDDEIAFIESMVREMDLSSKSEDGGFHE